MITFAIGRYFGLADIFQQGLEENTTTGSMVDNSEQPQTWKICLKYLGSSYLQCKFELIFHTVLFTGGKQWQTTPKNLPRMQHTRAIPVAWLNSGLCPNRPKG